MLIGVKHKITSAAKSMAALTLIIIPSRGSYRSSLLGRPYDKPMGRISHPHASSQDALRSIFSPLLVSIQKIRSRGDCKGPVISFFLPGFEDLLLYKFGFGLYENLRSPLSIHNASTWLFFYLYSHLDQDWFDAKHDP